MASSSLLLRRTLRTLSSLHRSLLASSATSAPPFSVPIHRGISPTSPSSQLPSHLVLSRAFRSSSISLLSARPSSNNNSDEIGPDTILFEGCDYNHWLIVMDFPKDPKPTPEEMVETYVQTCAKGLNISIEEAKKKMYACSTTTYTGFQAVMTEEESEKFNGLPGVIFVLPDSYIDPVNKEYGGDKYINGTIIPRPPPIQYGRSQVRRDRSRNADQPRYNRQGNPMSNPPGNPSYNNQGPMQGDGRNFGASQNYPPQQNYGPATQNYRTQQNFGPASQNYPPQQHYGPASQNYPPQQNYGPASQNYPPQQNIGPASQNFSQPQSYGSPSHQYEPQRNYNPPSPQYAPQQNFGPSGQGERRGTLPTQGGTGSYPLQNYGPSGQGERRNSVPTQGGTGAYQSQFREFTPSYMEEFKQPAQEPEGRSQLPGQGNLTGDNRTYGSAQSGTYGQGTHPGYSQNFSGHGVGDRFTQGEQRDAEGGQRSYAPLGRTGTEQGKY